jgi:hypothetical protein
MLLEPATRAVRSECDWVTAHEALSRLARERAAADAEEGRWLLAALRSAAHVHVGFGSFNQYVEHLFGYKPRSTQEKLRVAEALEELPQLARALDGGSLGWSAVRELTRVAVPDTEDEWLALAQGKTVRQLEELVGGKEPGDPPSSPNRPSARARVLRFEVTPETFALFREALRWLRRRGAENLDDDAVLLSMARHVLGHVREDGRASYQIALTVCAACGAGQQQAGGELVAVAADRVAMAHCDAQHLGHIPAHVANQNARPTEGSGETSTGGESTSAHVDAGAQSADARATDADAPVRGSPEDTPRRAKQTIPPALRRAVLARDRHCCRVPGCRNATFLDLHHIQLRSEGGRNKLGNLLTLCGAHHRAAHRGVLLIEGDSSAGVRFRHGDGTPYGDDVSPRALDVQAKAFSALRNLGFREGEVRAVLAEIRKEDSLRDSSIEHVMREALRRIRPRPAPRA